MLTPLKYRRWNRIKCTGLCAKVANISRDHFLINQPEFTKKLTGQKQDSVLVPQRVTGLSFGIRENVSRSLRILTILFSSKEKKAIKYLDVVD